MNQYREFIQQAKIHNDTEFRSLDPLKVRLDRFIFTFIPPLAVQLRSIYRLVCTLSHGQATVERGFSDNKFIEQDNLDTDNMIARRRVYSYMKEGGYDAATFPLTEKLLKSVDKSHEQYEKFRKEQQKKKTSDELNAEKIKLLDELADARKTKDQLTSSSTKFSMDADHLCLKAGKAKNYSDIMSLVLQSNTLRQKSNESKRKAETLDDQIKDIHKKLRLL